MDSQGIIYILYELGLDTRLGCETEKYPQMCIAKKPIHINIWIIDLVIRGMLKGQALLLRRVSDLEEVFEQRVEELRRILMKRVLGVMM